MLQFLEALTPTFLLILLGYGFSRAGFPGAGFWPMTERLTYYVLLPALFIENLTQARFDRLPVGRTAICLVAAVLAASAILVLLRRRLTVTPPAFTSIFQGSIRPNTYVGIAAASALYGAEGLTLSAMALMILVPLVNVLSVLALGRYGENRSGGGAGAVCLALLKNPLILSCVLGAILNLAGVRFPFGSGQVLRILGSVSLPLGLLAVGAGLSFAAIPEAARPILASSGFKLALLPAVTAVACIILGVGDSARGIAIIFTAVPVSASSFILARQLGGDHRLMASIITAQTALSALTMPLVLGALTG